jgi:hypothetical protein
VHNLKTGRKASTCSQYSSPADGWSNEGTCIAVHESGTGTFETCRPALKMSVDRGRPEVTGLANYIVIDALVFTNRASINALALNARMPTMHGLRESVQAGGLISYGPNFPELWRRSADYIDKILRGAKPADIPVEQPTKFDLVSISRSRRRSVSPCRRHCSPAPTR